MTTLEIWSLEPRKDFRVLVRVMKQKSPGFQAFIVTSFWRPFHMIVASPLNKQVRYIYKTRASSTCPSRHDSRPERIESRILPER